MRGREASDAKDNPNRDERWCYERQQAEWPEGPAELVKALFWVGDRYREEIPSIADSLADISITLKEILTHMQRNT